MFRLGWSRTSHVIFAVLKSCCTLFLGNYYTSTFTSQFERMNIGLYFLCIPSVFKRLFIRLIKRSHHPLLLKSDSFPGEGETSVSNWGVYWWEMILFLFPHVIILDRIDVNVCDISWSRSSCTPSCTLTDTEWVWNSRKLICCLIVGFHPYVRLRSISNNVLKAFKLLWKARTAFDCCIVVNIIVLINNWSKQVIHNIWTTCVQLRNLMI